MPELSRWIAFTASALALLLIPGPAVVFVVTRGAQHGKRAAVITAIGLGLGTFVHVFAATVGLSALLVSSATAFNVVRFAGAGYLMWLGVGKLRARTRSDGDAELVVTPALGTRRLLRQAFIVNVFNPKTALFFLAFLPQFADRSRGPIGPQLFALGSAFALLGMCTDSLYGTTARASADGCAAVARARWPDDSAAGCTSGSA
jgi:threonine/homoserine/homoserine lactone efflux protein